MRHVCHCTIVPQRARLTAMWRRHTSYDHAGITILMPRLSDYRNVNTQRGRIRIQALDETHCAQLVALSRATFADTFGSASGEENVNAYMDVAYHPDQLARELRDPNSLFFFAYDVTDGAPGAGEPIAYLKLAVEDSQSEHPFANAGEVMRIYVMPEAKGKKIGSTLLAFAEEIFAALGKDVVWLGVWEYNYPAQAFYARHGYRRFGEHSFPVGDDPQVDWMLSKPLTSTDGNDAVLGEGRA